MATTRSSSPAASGVARLVRARHLLSPTCTMPSGLMAPIATPVEPMIHSRPMVGVENRVRTIDGIPTTKVSNTPEITANKVNRPSRRSVPGSGS